MSEIEQLRAEVRALRDEIAGLRAEMVQRIEVHHYHHPVPEPAPQPAPSPGWLPWDSPNVCQAPGFPSDLQIEMGPGVSVEMTGGTRLP